MLRQFAGAAALGLMASFAIAGDWVGLDADADHDGTLTMNEVMAAWPEVSTDDFMRMDTDSNGLLDAGELTAARAEARSKPTGRSDLAAGDVAVAAVVHDDQQVQDDRAQQ